MNPETNRLEPLLDPNDPHSAIQKNLLRIQDLVRADGSPVPKTWSIFTDGELVVLKDYTFKVVRIGESYLVLEPVGPVVVDGGP